MPSGALELLEDEFVALAFVSWHSTPFKVVVSYLETLVCSAPLEACVCVWVTPERLHLLSLLSSDEPWVPRA